MKISIIFWGTQKYLDFLPNWYDSIENNFVKDIEKKYFVFTDGEIISPPSNLFLIPIPDYGFPDTFNKTFEELLKIKEQVMDDDWLVSIDADMLVKKEITYDEFFDNNKTYIGVHHPCHYMNMSPHNEFPGSFDINEESNACVKDIIDMSVYWQGCLWGGKVPEVFDMIEQLDLWTKSDVEKGVQARFYEESYMNKWFLLNKEQTHTLSPSFSFPQLYEDYCDFEQKIVHLHKDNKSYGNNSW